MRVVPALLVCVACARSLRTPPPIESMAEAPQASSADLLAAADAAWAARADPAQASEAERLYLQSARADPRMVQGWAGAIRAKAFRIGREKDAGERTRLAESAVAAGQLCEQNAPAAAACDYWLAAALGLQARERTATAHDALPHIVDLLRRASGSDPRIDAAGPHRLLAILLLRAPGWPLGPGDSEAALSEAKAAVQLAPDYPPNQLALGEALRKNGRATEAKAAYLQALRLASAGEFSADPDATGWADEARAALR